MIVDRNLSSKKRKVFNNKSKKKTEIKISKIKIE